MTPLWLAMIGVPPAPVSGPRVVPLAPLTGLPPAPIDQRLASVGIANTLSKAKDLQARVLWVDGTANMDRVNSVAKVDGLVDRAALAGFNTIVYDVKPISGYTMYPSRLTDQITSWRDGKFESGYDPVAPIIAAARRNGLSIFLALNAFSEGHRAILDRGADLKPSPSKAGWGYEHKELQTVQYLPHPTWEPAPGAVINLQEQPDPKLPKAGAVYLTTSAVPASDLYVVLTGDGTIKEVTSAKPAVPEGGSVLALNGENAEIAEKWAKSGQIASFGSTGEFLPISERQTQLPLMMNPHNPANQDRALSFIREVMGRYAADGVIYDDRLRFGGLNSDFSPLTRQLFEKHLGRQIHWPDDVFRFTYTTRLNRGPDGKPFTAIRPGPYFDAWLAWRSQEMAKFIRRVREAAVSTRPSAKVAVYAGSWYGDYAQYGNNYGSPSLSAGFPFMTPSYQSTGFAGSIDFLITGCYYPIGTMQEASERGLPVGRTVEAGGLLSNRVARDATWTYAGVMLADYWSNPKKLEPALQAAAATTQGIMVFDLSHRMEQFWPIFDRAFRVRKKAPHQSAGLLAEVRKVRAQWDKAGYRDAPFPMIEGAPGAGF